MSVDRKMMREEIYFLLFLFTAIGLTCGVVWWAHG